MSSGISKSLPVFVTTLARLTNMFYTPILHAMAKKESEDTRFEEVRNEALTAFKKIYKDSLAFDLARVSKEDRIRLLSDEEYLSETKAMKAELYAKQLKILSAAIEGEYSDPEKSSANEILKALEMRNKLLFNDLNIEADDTNALNIVMITMTREDYMAMETVEVSLKNSNQGADISFDVEE